MPAGKSCGPAVFAFLECPRRSMSVQRAVKLGTDNDRPIRLSRLNQKSMGR